MYSKSVSLNLVLVEEECETMFGVLQVCMILSQINEKIRMIKD
jgi:hypothetical protein